MFAISAHGVNMYTLQEKPRRLKPGEARERGAPEGEASALVSHLQQVQVLQEVQPHTAH